MPPSPGTGAGAGHAPKHLRDVAPARGTGAFLDRLVDRDVDVEEQADRLLAGTASFIVFPQGEALALVLDERVALGHRAQADAPLQVVHLVEVLAPLAVQDREHDPPLDLAHDLLAEGRSRWS